MFHTLGREIKENINLSHAVEPVSLMQRDTGARQLCATSSQRREQIDSHWPLRQVKISMHHSVASAMSCRK